MDCNVGHLWIPALKDLGSLLLPVIIRLLLHMKGTSKTRPDEQLNPIHQRKVSQTPADEHPTRPNHTNQTNQTIPNDQTRPDGLVLVGLEAGNLLGLEELFRTQSCSPQLEIAWRAEKKRGFGVKVIEWYDDDYDIVYMCP